jgi:mannose-6-phosphate isomerase-like protein (cupin superfamily)
MRAIFKADCDETASRYSVAEWWLEARTRGPDVHEHSEDHVYYVLGGIVSLFLGDEWSEVPQGACVVIPGGTPHSFKNRSSSRAGFLSFTLPGGFEARMKDIEQHMAAEDLRL